MPQKDPIAKPPNIQKIYLTLTLFNTLAASFIWGINTLFLLDAGLTNTQAFAANAFFTAGMMVFEVPTGVIADTWGRRASYMLGTITLGVSTLLYLWAWQAHAPFWAWIVTSIMLGLGFTFFSGATEAWLVDALGAVKFKGSLESVFAKGQIVGGIAMLTGSVAGGYIAQVTNLGVPYILRAGVLGVNFFIAYFLMKDLGFSPRRSASIAHDVKHTLKSSIDHGLRNPSVRWVMLAAPFSGGVGIYAFYAAQPYLLKLYGNSHAYGVAGLAAAIVAGAQILGGFVVPHIRKVFKKRTSVLLTGVVLSAVLLAAIGLTSSFALAIALLVVWGLTFAALSPIRQAYLNGLIPTQERATVLSFDSLMSSAGGVVIQPILGRVADTAGYAASYVAAGGFQVLAAPFILLARRTRPTSDPLRSDKG